MCKDTISTYEVLQKFPNNETGRLYLESKRWGEQIICSHCNEPKLTKTKSIRGIYRCNSCRKEFNVKTNTIFERSHIPLYKWLYTIYQVVTARKGISSMQLSKELGITQKSTWFLLQRIRVACVNPNEFVYQYSRSR